MILKADFLTHWKTRRLHLRLGPDAVLGLIRLWLHCEARRRWEFPGMLPDELAAIAEWPGSADQFAEELARLRWVDPLEGGGFRAHEWDQHNAHLVSNWRNGEFGRLGGRPKKSRASTRENPLGSHCVTSGMPLPTQLKTPAQHSTAQDRILQPAPPTAGELPLRGEPDRKPKAKASRQPNPLFDALAELDNHGGTEELTESAAKAVGKALSEIKRASPSVTPDEIRRRAANLPLHLPNATATASSLGKHWARCANPPRPMNGQGRPGGELAEVEAEIRKLERVCRESNREAQRPENQRRLKELWERRSKLLGGATP